jgi:CubicO group peptidase (beta-lactamase class C family)
MEDNLEIVPPESVGLSAARLQRLDAGMQRYVDRGQVAGLVTLLARRGRVAHLGVYGQMDLAAARPMRADAIFRLFSMTKPITSLAVLMLYEEGHFHLQYPISLFIPVFNDLKVLQNQLDAHSERVALARPITIHDLLTHTSGLGYGLDALTPVDTLFLQAKMLRMDESLAEKMTRLAQFPLHHQPGLRYTYSIATDVLGRLVEIVSGMPLDAFCQQRLFEPLGMADTGFYVPAEKRERLAVMYTPAPNGALPSPPGRGQVRGALVDMSTFDSALLPHFMAGAWINKEEKPQFLSGGGGLVSTAADYLRFVMLLRNQGELDGVRLVSRKTIELMTSPHLRQEQFFVNGCSYGLGLTVLTDPARAQMLGSAGAYGGGGAASTDFWVDPQEDLLGILMVQYASYTPLALGMDFKVLAAQAIMD